MSAMRVVREVLVRVVPKHLNRWEASHLKPVVRAYPGLKIMEERVQANWRWLRRAEVAADGRGGLIRQMALREGVPFDHMVEIVGSMRQRGVRLPKPL